MRMTDLVLPKPRKTPVNRKHTSLRPGGGVQGQVAGSSRSWELSPGPAPSHVTAPDVQSAGRQGGSKCCPPSAPVHEELGGLARMRAARCPVD